MDNALCIFGHSGVFINHRYFLIATVKGWVDWAMYYVFLSFIIYLYFTITTLKYLLFIITLLLLLCSIVVSIYCLLLLHNYYCNGVLGGYVWYTFPNLVRELIILLLVHWSIYYFLLLYFSYSAVLVENVI